MIFGERGYACISGNTFSWFIIRPPIGKLTTVCIIVIEVNFIFRLISQAVGDCSKKGGLLYILGGTKLEIMRDISSIEYRDTSHEKKERILCTAEKENMVKQTCFLGACHKLWTFEKKA